VTPLVSLLASIVLALAAGSAPAGAEPIEVLSFNIRYDHPGDGEHAWPRRRDLVIETIRDGGADFIGLQEVLPHQRRQIEQALADSNDKAPRYGSIGRSREASVGHGEATPLYHRLDRWESLDAGTFWLSTTPEVAGSRDWQSACPRIATWGRFKRRTSGPSETLLVVNTHFDHASADARREGAKVLAAFLAAMRSAEPSVGVVVMGDLNAPPSDPAVATLLAANLVDTHLAAGGDERFGTFHGFKGRDAAVGRPRIDFILADRSLEVLAASIDRREPDGRPPSDHHPVRATIRRRAPEP
jgi:endonuclease/exonuclease/phosphatase family metal-dependent hydrolase